MSAPEEKKKMPRLMKTVCQEIVDHPNYKNLNHDATVTLFCVSVQGGAWFTKQNNARCRKIWRILYWGEEDTIGLY